MGDIKMTRKEFMRELEFLLQDISDEEREEALAFYENYFDEDVVDYINRFRLHHIKVISMTNSANSTIARISDLNIPYYINVETYQETNITSQLPVVYLLEYLAREVYYQKHKDM